MKMRMTAAAAGLTAALLLIGCVSTTAFHTTIAPRPGTGGRITTPARDGEPPDCYRQGIDSVCVSYVEFDDFGNPLNRKQMLRAVNEAVNAMAEDGVVLVFAHGWHNDAKPCPEVESANCTRDVRQFIQLVRRVGDMAKFKGRPIRGVYIGWRGDSIEAKGITWPLSMLGTFWDRKAAAHQIGYSGGVYELLSRISDARRANGNARLLVHGHSFGGAIVYSALSHHLMDQIRRDEHTRSTAALTLAKSRGEEARRQDREVQPFADLVLLLNPAFEAMRLRPQLDLARSQDYPQGERNEDDPALPPRLVILTTDADWATRRMFPLGRFFSTQLDSYADDDAEAENRTGVGHHIPYITHQLTAVDSCPPPPPEQRKVYPGAVSSRPTLCFPGKYAVSGTAPKAVQLTRCDKPGLCTAVAGDHFLERGSPQEGRIPYRMPILNIRTNASVSTGHNDIRSGPIENFMLSLMEIAAEDSILVPFNLGKPGPPVPLFTK